MERGKVLSFNLESPFFWILGRMKKLEFFLLFFFFFFFFSSVDFIYLAMIIFVEEAFDPCICAALEGDHLTRRSLLLITLKVGMTVTFVLYLF